MGFPGGSVVKNPSAKQERQVWLLSQEDPLEKEMAVHSSIVFLPEKSHGQRKPGELQSLRLQRVGYDFTTKQQQTINGIFPFFLSRK